MGEPAKNYAANNPKAVVYNAKRLMGHSFDEASVKEDSKNLPFYVKAVEIGRTKIQVPYKGDNIELFPQETAAQILLNLKKLVEKRLGMPSSQFQHILICHNVKLQWMQQNLLT